MKNKSEVIVNINYKFYKNKEKLYNMYNTICKQIHFKQIIVDLKFKMLTEKLGFCSNV